ncbi:RNA polymerase sigma-70 factor, ECF subfamily [Porphyromonadaceae bacterium KHP3R9]|jgi:DNA-directed RNA polymerase specialized sigma24 family protein|nr:RNA polymerase sigma-70 factor, ECF subfamily [Porphyromonadaceae bacterium KHP3R9]
MNESALKDNTVHINSRTLQLLREGDERAFEQIFNFYYNRIYSFALNTLFDKTFAEDITQTVFITLWEKRETIEPEIDIAPLLYRKSRAFVTIFTALFPMFFPYP